MTTPNIAMYRDRVRVTPLRQYEGFDATEDYAEVDALELRAQIEYRQQLVRLGQGEEALADRVVRIVSPARPITESDKIELLSDAIKPGQAPSIMRVSAITNRGRVEIYEVLFGPSRRAQ